MFNNENIAQIPSKLIDKYGRTINYLRLSITDRCNLRCFYCNNCINYQYIPHSNILTYEECLSLIGLSYSLEVSKVRITGGEPFVRKDFNQFLEQTMKQFPKIDLRITTNGTLLSTPEISYLKGIGLDYINISLDTLNRKKFESITGRNYYFRVRKAIDDCLNHDIKVKLNVVAMCTINDNELADFVQFALANPVDVRFIEFMPIGDSTMWDNHYFWSAQDILKDIREITYIKPISEQSKSSGPARMYELPKGYGRIGVISPMSDHFCERCNRFRITPDGKLRTCLFSDKEYNLRSILRSPKLGMDKVLQVMKKANERKLLGYKLLAKNKGQNMVCHRIMTSIGG